MLIPQVWRHFYSPKPSHFTWKIRPVRDSWWEKQLNLSWIMKDKELRMFSESPIPVPREEAHKLWLGHATEVQQDWHTSDIEMRRKRIKNLKLFIFSRESKASERLNIRRLMSWHLEVLKATGMCKIQLHHHLPCLTAYPFLQFQLPVVNHSLKI